MSFPRGPIVLLGRNGQGKTNLVEAIAYLSTFSSHRSSGDAALLRRNMGDATDPAAAVVRVRVSHNDKPQLLELEIVQGKANRARLNRGPIRPRDLLGRLRTVVFAPEDLQLLRGEPGDRRRFLDDIATQLKPSHRQLRRDFDKVLRQRGALLKQLGGARGADPVFVEESLASWDEALVEMSAQITAHRMAVVNSLRPAFMGYYEALAGTQKETGMEYRAKLGEQQRVRGLQGAEDPRLTQLGVTGGYFDDLSGGVDLLAEQYREMLPLERQNELRRRVNLVGAHRDDVGVSLQGFPIRGYASQGETWSAVLALRLAEKDLLRVGDDTPVLILDDVFSELDEERGLALVNLLEDVEQVFVTAAVGADIPPTLGAEFYRVSWDPAEGSKVSSGLAGEDV